MFKRVLFFIAVSVCSLQASQCECKSGQVNSAAQVAITLKDIIFEGENVFIELKGECYPVQSLVRNGAQWLATISGQNAFCPNGHNVCGRCYQCHTFGCPFAVLPSCWARGR